MDCATWAFIVLLREAIRDKAILFLNIPELFPSVVGGSNCQKETSPKTNALFMEIAEDKAILAWTLVGATGRKSPMVLRQKVSCL